MIVLIGFMGAGKTTVGRLLAARLGLPFLDSDDVIEQATARRVRDIFEADGEPAFRAVEHATVAGLLTGPDVVLALGGGAAVHPDTHATLCSSGATVVHLSIAFDQAMQRVGGDPGRPMLARPDLAEVFAVRADAYARAATVVVDAGSGRVQDVVDAVLDALARSGRLPG